jgi:hypothetical protein
MYWPSVDLAILYAGRATFFGDLVILLIGDYLIKERRHHKC